MQFATPERSSSASSISSETVAAVIVTYHPDAGFAERLEGTARQVGYVIVVDNHSESRALRQLVTHRIELIENPRNLGIGAALNQGLHRAMALGYRWVLTVDQDSELGPDLVEVLGQIYAECPFAVHVGLLNANQRSKRSGQIAVRCTFSSQTFTEAKTVITSGSLMSVGAYAAVGPFREDFFIEGVDLEYCLRLRIRGFRVLVSCRPLMTHSAGSMEEHRLGNRVVLVPNHAPWRYYYMTRNLLRIFAVYLVLDPGWVAVALRNLVRTFIRMVLFEDQRAAKLKCVMIGAWDAFTGSHGNRFLPD